MTEDHTAAETDWLAHSPDGYGYGYTKKQALLAMAQYLDDHDETTVDLVEHVGDARTGMMGWEVDVFVSGERLTLRRDDIEVLRGAANAVDSAGERVLDTADREEIEGPPR